MAENTPPARSAAADIDMMAQLAPASLLARQKELTVQRWKRGLTAAEFEELLMINQRLVQGQDSP
jgi:hypothetical protein